MKPRPLSSKAIFTCVLLVFLILPFITNVSTVGSPLSQDLEIPTTPHGFNIVIDNINETNIIENVKFLSARSRVSGYPGFFEAADYIASRFEEYGIQTYGGEETYFEWFNITTPIDHGAFLTLSDGTKIKAYMFSPNYVNPCPYISPEDGDILIYAGKGEFEDFEGLNVTGKFVLMDFASRWHFYLAMAGGAKGAIYVPENPNLVTRPEADEKEVLMPVLFPRLYIRPEDGGEELLNLARQSRTEGIKVHIDANMTWENVRVPNVVGYIQGKDSVLSKQIVVISAYYDSWSIVPGLSYGATDSLGVSDLLEIARYLSAHRPKRSVLIVALAGHYQGLWGAREFVERHFNELESQIIAFAGMDLSSGSDQIGVYATGAAYLYNRPDILYPTRYSWLVTQFFQKYLTEMKMVLGPEYGENFVDGIQGTHPAYISSVRPLEPRVYGTFSFAPTLYMSSAGYYQTLSFAFDSDPFVLAMYGSGFTYHTSDDIRLYQRSPADTWEKINFENVLTQVKFVHCTLWALLNEGEIALKPTKSRFKDDWGYVTLTIQVSEYNMLTAYWDAFNSTRHPDLWDDVLVVFGSYGLRTITKIDRNGNAVIHGLKPYQNGFVDAYVVDKETGKVMWSADFGVWAAPGGGMVPTTSYPYTKLISVFPCASIAIIFAFNPSSFSFIPMGSINDARGHGPMLRMNGVAYDTYFMVFVQPDIPAEVIFMAGGKLPIAVLNNADPQNPNGKGYVLKQGELLIVGPDEIVENMKTMILSRYDKLFSYHTYTPTMRIYYEYASDHLSSWDSSYAKNEIQRTLGYGYFSWTFLLGLYGTVMDLTWQVILTLSVLFTITIPFSLVIERLIFGYEGKKRFFVISLIVLVSNLIFYFFHPGFTIANSSPLVLICACLLVILAPLLSLIFNETRASAQSIRGKVRGASHFSEISRSGLFSSSMSMSIENMKKRRFRTLLTLLSIVLIIFGMVSLSSVTTTPQLISGAGGIGNPSSFSGVLIRATPWAPINEGVYTILKSSLSGLAEVVPRGWLYPPPLPARVSQAGAPIPYIIFSPEMQTRIYGIIALSYEEPKISNIDKNLVAGTWFLENDVYAAILPDTVADSLSNELGREIAPGSDISLWGLTLTVRGIINAEALDNFYNPDGEKITPWDTTSTTIPPSHFYASNVFIIPYSLFSRIVYITPITTIAIKPVNQTVEDTLLKELPFQLAYRIYKADEGKLGYYRVFQQWLGVLGYQYLIVPILIASFAILNLMLGSVYERTKEIAVYNAIGMSPMHISLSFIVESISYALPAIFSGYLAGLIMTAALISLGTYPSDLYPNFSSTTVLIVLGLGLAVTALSSTYPSILAARLAVPSRVRRWQKGISKPKGDFWEVTIPLIINAREEVFGVYSYLREYLSFSMQRESLFAAEKIEVKESKEGDAQIIRFIADCRLAPYDLGIKSDIIMEGVKENRDAPFTFKLTLQRTAGYATTWRTSCPSVADEIRKQILIWRTLTPEDRRRYIQLGQQTGENE